MVSFRLRSNPMDPKHGEGRMFLAPGAAASASNYSFPSVDRRPTQPAFPRVDDHLVQPEVSREEIIRGRKIITMGANPEHADAHSQLDFLIAPHVCEGCATGSDLLTRVNQGSNFATDVSVRKKGIDPQTGARYLEELSFEVVNEQAKSTAIEKAEDLIRRGVRRVFAIFVKAGYVGEWSPAKHEFIRLRAQDMIDDRLLIRPIAVRALLDAGIAECEVARALLQKGNPEIKRIIDESEKKAHKKGLDEGHKKGLDEGHKKGLDEGEKEGHKKGLDEGEKKGRRSFLLALVRKRFGDVPRTIEKRVREANADQMDAWAERLFVAASLDDVFPNEVD